MEFTTENIQIIMEFTTENIQNMIDFYTFFVCDKQTRKEAIDKLNYEFFPDKICKFVDISSDSQNYMSVMIEYKNSHYNILAYNLVVKQKIERLKKLEKLCLSQEI